MAKKKPKDLGEAVDKKQTDAITSSMKERLEMFSRAGLNPHDRSARLPGVPKELTAIQKAVVNLAAAGWKAKEISTQLGVALSTVRNVMHSASGKLAIDKIQQEIYIKEPQKVAQYMAPRAMKTLYDIMTKASSKETSRVEAAKAVLDRAYGKPVQQIENKGNTIADLFRELDRRETIEGDFVDVEKELKKYDATSEDEGSDEGAEEVHLEE